MNIIFTTDFISIPPIQLSSSSSSVAPQTSNYQQSVCNSQARADGQLGPAYIATRDHDTWPWRRVTTTQPGIREHHLSTNNKTTNATSRRLDARSAAVKLKQRVDGAVPSQQRSYYPQLSYITQFIADNSGHQTISHNIRNQTHNNLQWGSCYLSLASVSQSVRLSVWRARYNK